jgi:Cathepsin propeptide inhibitor domain (I29)
LSGLHLLNSVHRSSVNTFCSGFTDWAKSGESTRSATLQQIAWRKPTLMLARWRDFLSNKKISRLMNSKMEVVNFKASIAVILGVCLLCQTVAATPFVLEVKDRQSDDIEVKRHKLHLKDYLNNYVSPYFVDMCLVQDWQAFREWQLKFNKNYSSNEVEATNRFAIWKENNAMINRHNRMDVGFKVRVSTVTVSRSANILPHVLS